MGNLPRMGQIVRGKGAKNFTGGGAFHHWYSSPLQAALFFSEIGLGFYFHGKCYFFIYFHCKALLKGFYAGFK